MKELIVDKAGTGAYAFISKHIDLAQEKCLMLSTGEAFNIIKEPDLKYPSIINLKRLNDVQDINSFLETINSKLDLNGLFIGCVETSKHRKERIRRKFIPVFSHIYLFFDSLFKNVFPQFGFTRRLYFFITAGRNRYITRAEAFGRVYACGFRIIASQTINNNEYFVAQKIRDPYYDHQSSYGIIIKLKRIGKDGKEIDFYKFRTMYPFSEYLQEYIYENNSLRSGGKFGNDFRISFGGRLMRKYWLDELPMLINFIKGDLKFVGVRPITQQYLNLYSAELQQIRLKHKPGLIPAIYAERPETLEEINIAELNYLNLYNKNPLLTDAKYFFKVIYNILFKGVRSN